MIKLSEKLTSTKWNVYDGNNRFLGEFVPSLVLGYDNIQYFYFLANPYIVISKRLQKEVNKKLNKINESQRTSNKT